MPLKANQFGFKFDWYQTEPEVFVSVMRRDAPADKTKVSLTDDNNRLQITVDDQLVCDMNLARPVLEEIKHTCRPAKIEVKLKKKSAGNWSTLEAVPVDDKTANLQYPTSSTHGPVNWDAIEKQAEKEEEEEKLDGDAAVNKLFQQIYKDASDDTKRAMMKSFVGAFFRFVDTNRSQLVNAKLYCDRRCFSSRDYYCWSSNPQESGGTVLSTNWNEVGKQKVECKPPEGMEFKKYEQ